jgi:hypothetical protein
MTTKPRPAKKGAATKTLLRGVQLIDFVMARRKTKGEKLKGMPAAQLAKTNLGKVPLTPSLQRWLEFDDDTFILGEPQSFPEMMETEFSEWADAFAPVAKRLKAKVVLFEGWGSDSRRFLYLGKTDSHGEYPVMTIDTDDLPFLCVNGPVDVWLAQQVGYLETEKVYGHVPAAYLAAQQEQADLNFGGELIWELDGESFED